MARSGLTEAQRSVLKTAPIGVDHDIGNGDPHNAPRFKYHGADGRVASGLWTRGLLKYCAVSHEPGYGGVLRITPAGRAALAETEGRSDAG